jgi:hypothetical protein
MARNRSRLKGKPTFSIVIVDGKNVIAERQDVTVANRSLDSIIDSPGERWQR